MQPRHASYSGLLFTALTFLLAPDILAADLLVYTIADAGGGSLRQAVNDNNAIGGSNRIVFSNIVSGTITLTGGELVIRTNVSIVGPGPDVLAVSGNNASRIFRITNAVATITGLSIINGRANASSGGGILNNGTLLLTDCTVSNCSAQISGGGIDSSGSATVVRSSIINNQSTGYASGLDGFVRLTNCTVAGNVGVVAVGGGTVIWNTTISGNMGRGMYGGGMPPPLIANTILAGNTDLDALGTFTSAGYNLIGKGDQATGFTGIGDQVGTTNGPLNPNLRAVGFHGGPTPTMPPLPGSLAIDQGKSFGLTNDQRGRLRPFDDPAVFNATLGDGAEIGAVEIRPGYSVPLLVTTTNDAGPGSLRQAILHASSFEYDNIRFATNVTDTIRLTSGELVVNKPLSIEGPGIQWFGGPPARKLTISGNNTSRVFHLSGGQVSIYALTIAEGLTNQGGGILVQAGSHYLFGCHVVSNVSTYTGGGIQVNNASLSLNECSLTHNQADFSGGGIYQGGSSTFSSFLDVFNCTIASNRTTGVPDILQPAGGGIGRAFGSLAIYSSTIASNSSYFGGGIDTSFSANTADIRGSIIAGNSAATFGPDVSGTFDTGGYNIIGNTNGSTGFGEEPGDQLNVNPLLGPLANYGGPTPAMALRAGSPAIDKSKSFGGSFDQRYFSRTLDDTNLSNAPGGDGTDIGAFEVDPNLRIVELRQFGSDVALGLLTVLGRNYRAEYTNDLASGNWTIFTNNLPGNGYLLWVTNYGGANEPRRFYRGALVP